MNAAYEEYLHSAQWREVSAKRKALDGYKCQCCGGTESIAAHHVKYPANWYDTECGHLITICKGCHTIVHRLIEEDAKWDNAREYAKERGSHISEAARQKVRFECARILVVELWKRNLFSTKAAVDFCKSIVNIANMGGRNIYADMTWIMPILATAKDCLVANGEPVFDRSKQKYRKLGKTKYKQG